MMTGRLDHARAGLQFRQNFAEQAGLGHLGAGPVGLAGGQDQVEFVADPLRRRGDDKCALLPHQGQRAGLDGEPEAGGEPEHAQQAQRVGGEGVAPGRANAARGQVLPAAGGIEQIDPGRAVRPGAPQQRVDPQGHGVDGQVPPGEFIKDVGRAFAECGKINGHRPADHPGRVLAPPQFHVGAAAQSGKACRPGAGAVPDREVDVRRFHPSQQVTHHPAGQVERSAQFPQEDHQVAAQPGGQEVDHPLARHLRREWRHHLRSARRAGHRRPGP